MTDHVRTGVVLAGGYSTRFGDEDKAFAEIDGTPMLARVVDRLSRTVETVIVSCRDDQRASFETVLDGVGESPIQFVTDPQPDGGPLVGITTAFETVDSTYAAVVGCDMPFCDPSFVEFLFDQALTHDAAVPEREDGHLQPMQAVYHVDRTRQVAARRLSAEKRSLHGTLAELDTVVIPPETVSTQTSWKSLSDLNLRTDVDQFE